MSHPARGEKKTPRESEIKAKHFDDTTAKHLLLFPLFITYIPDVVFGNAVVNVAAVGPVDDDSWSGVAESDENRKWDSDLRNGSKKKKNAD